MTLAPLLTPAAIMALLHIKDRHTLARLAARGVLERINISGGEKQARWRYRLKSLEAQPPQISAEELHYQELKQRHGW